MEAYEIRRERVVIGLTGWTPDEYDRADRQRVGAMIVDLTMEAGVEANRRYNQANAAPRPARRRGR